jgi:ribosomal protein S18 acetylase RimI-like enzyme
VSEIVIRPAATDAEVAAVRGLFEAYYAEWLSADVCFRDFAAELADLPGKYAPPGGCLLVAWDGDRPAGCIALRPLAPGVGEVKRLYVPPDYRGRGVGRRLAAAVLAAARDAGHEAVRLDTMPAMTGAQRLYESLGFVDVPRNPGDTHFGARYLEKRLDG